MIRLTDKHAFFYTEWPSNFYKTSFEWEAFGEKPKFFCTEQAFMWAKAKYFGDQETADNILLEKSSPMKCKQLGRLVRGYNDLQWSIVRYSFMHDVNYAKYTQDHELQAKLLDKQFDGKTFVEASPTDCIWGIGFAQSTAPDEEIFWLGQNLLGKVITQVRAEILADKSLDHVSVSEFAFTYSDFGHLLVDKACLAKSRCKHLEILCSGDPRMNPSDKEIAKLKRIGDELWADRIEMKMNIFVDNVCIKLTWRLDELDAAFNALSLHAQSTSFRTIADIIEAAAKWFAGHSLVEVNEMFYKKAEQEVAAKIVDRMLRS